MTIPSDEKRICLAEKLSPQNIILELKSDNKTDLINELAERLKGQPSLLNFNQFVKDIFKREEDTSTGVGDGVAIPHARTNAVNDFVVAIGRRKPGIDFNAVDGQPVEVVIMMGTPLEKVSLYLRLLAHLSHLLKRPGFTEGLKNATTPQEIIDLFFRNETGD